MEGTTRIVSVVGKKNCGKTTLIVALAQTFVRRKKRVATIKHGTHPATMDREGTDTWRHFHEASAERVLIEAPGTRHYMERIEEESDPIALARRFMGDVDVVLVEGFTTSDLPKIEVYRKAEHAAPRYDPSLPNAGCWKAMITDDTTFKASFPVFSFNDTAWMTAITAIAWESAMLL